LGNKPGTVDQFVTIKTHGAIWQCV
jgi:hypothetical protein